jgi:hypothetical protein
LLHQSAVFTFSYWPLLLLAAAYSIRFFTSAPFPSAKTFSVSALFCDQSSEAEEGVYLSTLAVALACLVVLGTNTGAWLSYYYQMATPPLIVVGLVALSRLRSDVHRSLFAVLIVFFSLFHAGIGHSPSPFPVYSGQEVANWRAAEQLLADHKAGAKIVSPILMGRVDKDPATVFDNGNSEYWENLAPNGEKPSIIDGLFPNRLDYSRRFSAYYHHMNQRIERREFSLIAVTKDRHPLVPQNILEQNYEVVQEISLQTGRQHWRTEFWVPKK